MAKQKVVVVTGASKGIGAAAAIAFGAAGFDVVVNYRSDSGAAKAVAKQIEAAGSKALPVQADAATEMGVTVLFDVVKRSFGQVDVLVNNAGQPHEAKFGDWTQASLADSLMGNFGSAALCTQEAAPLMNPGSSILFTSSVYGLNMAGSARAIMYSVGKAALISFAQTMAEKLAPDIRCNVVAPGTTKTPMWDGVGQDYLDWKLGLNLQKEWVAAEEVAAAMLFLVQTPHINAQTIVVDAGWQKRPVGPAPERRKTS